MQTYKRDKKKVALFDFEWSALWVVLMVAIFAFTGFTVINAIEIAAFALAYCLLFGRAVMSSYRKAVVIDDDGIRLINAHDRLYSYDAPYSEIIAFGYAPSHLYGNPAIQIRLKNKNKVLIDGSYENASKLWECIVSSGAANSPEAPVDGRIIKYIDKLKKKEAKAAEKGLKELKKDAEDTDPEE